MTGKIAASGNIQSLLKADCSRTDAPEYCYRNMFNDCTSLTAAPELLATTIGNFCYSYIFSGCTSLSAAPALPATTLAYYCYSSMFNGCSSLTTAPTLPATTLGSYCYNGMFQDCTSLADAPVLPATTLADNCYRSMFYGCTSLSAVNVKFTAWNPSTATSNWLNGVAASGTFTCPAALGTDSTITRGSSNCPTSWTVVNV